MIFTSSLCSWDKRLSGNWKLIPQMENHSTIYDYKVLSALKDFEIVLVFYQFWLIYHYLKTSSCILHEFWPFNRDIKIDSNSVFCQCFPEGNFNFIFQHFFKNKVSLKNEKFQKQIWNWKENIISNRYNYSMIWLIYENRKTKQFSYIEKYLCLPVQCS